MLARGREARKFNKGWHAMGKADEDGSGAARLNLSFVWKAQPGMDHCGEQALDALREALAAGASSNLSHKKDKTPLAYACEIGARAAAEILLDHGALPSKRNGIGKTPLMEAASAGQVELVKLMLARGALPSEAWSLESGEEPGSSCMGVTALHLAAGAGSQECVEALMDAGADPLAKSEWTEMTPADIARHNRHVQVATFIEWKIAQGHALEIAEAAAMASASNGGKLRL